MRATENTTSWRNVDMRVSAGQGKTRRPHSVLLGMVLVFALTAASGWAAEVPACPASPNFPDFSGNKTCLALNGNASFPLESTVLQITPAVAGQAGSVWYTTPQAVQNGFTTTFQFQFTNATNPPADGIAFVIQNSGTSAIGFTGSGGALADPVDDAGR